MVINVNGTFAVRTDRLGRKRWCLASVCLDQRQRRWHRTPSDLLLFLLKAPLLVLLVLMEP